MKRPSLISRTSICSLAQSEPPQPYMLWKGSHWAYIDRIRFWFGSTTSVIDYAVSKSIKLPLVRLAGGILLGYNFYEYVLYIPRKVWRRVSSKIKRALPYSRARVRHPSFRWEAGSGERIIYGGGQLIAALISCGILKPERAMLRGDMFPIPESTW
jgi:hypothetical protein